MISFGDENKVNKSHMNFGSSLITHMNIKHSNASGNAYEADRRREVERRETEGKEVLGDRGGMSQGFSIDFRHKLLC